VLFEASEVTLTGAGFLAMGGQIVDASIIAKPMRLGTTGLNCPPTAYRFRANERFLAENGQRSPITARSRRASRCPGTRTGRTMIGW
jgi:hypothetical protein